MNPLSRPASPPPLRWWPAGLLLLLAAMAVLWVRSRAEWPFQKRNLTTWEILIVATLLLVVWWTFLSRAPQRLRLSVTFGFVVLAMVGAALFRLGGMSGDMVPILEFRWSSRVPPATEVGGSASAHQSFNPVAPSAFPQFYGPNRDGVLAGPVLETNWTAHPPREVWRRPIGPGWSGFVVVGDACLTQEQRGAEECVVARSLNTGGQLWVHADEARYRTTIAGEGPRATPTVAGNRVFAHGATGILNCLDLATGKRIWSRDVVHESGGKVPQWGASCSPLVVNDMVVVHGGEAGSHSLFAFRITDGELVWKSGSASSYASPIHATLAGVPQVLAFNDGSMSGHDPASGATLWERDWGNGNVVCATPLVVTSNRVLFSSGYGVGAGLIELSQRAEGGLEAARIWKSSRMKAKFAHLFIHDGCLFGLDDGVFACVDLQDGSQKWREGRYGHGQGLLVGDLYLLLSESGELVLLRPTPAAPNELARIRVLHSRTWNPIALSGDLLLVRNDHEAVCLRITTVH